MKQLNLLEVSIYFLLASNASSTRKNINIRVNTGQEATHTRVNIDQEQQKPLHCVLVVFTMISEKRMGSSCSVLHCFGRHTILNKNCYELSHAFSTRSSFSEKERKQTLSV